MKPKKRLHITLIELLLVITLLVLLSGVVGINIRRAFSEQRFRAELAAVVSSLRLAQDLMLILNTDVHLIFRDDPQEGLHYWLQVEKKLSGGWDRELARKRARLTAIQLVEMEDQTAESRGQNDLDIRFLSGGSVMSKGLLNLFSSRNKNGADTLVSSICLPGYPKPIVSSSQEMKAEECGFAKAAELDELLTRDMLNEIQPRFVISKK